MTARDWLADWLTQRAASRLSRDYPDWAAAIRGEHASIHDKEDRLGWAFGVFRASLFPPETDFSYFVLLTCAILLMALYQWSFDEGVATLLTLGGLGVCLGFFRPQHFLLSGLAIGLVVTAVIGFESMSGIRPVYEIYPRTLAHCIHWLILVIPALISSAAGRQIRLKLFA